MAELWEGRGLGSWLHDSTAPPNFPSRCLLMGSSSYAGTLARGCQSSSPLSAHALPTAGSHTREQKFRKICTPQIWASQAQAGSHPEDPAAPSGLVAYQEEAPGRDKSVGGRTGHRRRLTGTQALKTKPKGPKTHPAGAGTHLGARRITGEGAAGLGAPRTQAAPGSSSEWALRNVSSPSSTVHLSHQRVTIGSADK